MNRKRIISHQHVSGSSHPWGLWTSERKEEDVSAAEQPENETPEQQRKLRNRNN